MKKFLNKKNILFAYNKNFTYLCINKQKRYEQHGKRIQTKV
jgi:peroxiredoxin